jgi:hypothetical protein
MNLIQARHAKTAGVSFVGITATAAVNPSGAAAPLDETGYAAVADRCCQAEMQVFIIS